MSKEFRLIHEAIAKQQKQWAEDMYESAMTPYEHQRKKAEERRAYQRWTARMGRRWERDAQTYGAVLALLAAMTVGYAAGAVWGW